LKRVQRSLNRPGFEAGVVDGLMGCNTCAVGVFQQSEGLTRTGRLDTTTQELLKARADAAGI
jgi:peptidoglycan hydrolase-like protein with peptidoglycan-binding domain